MESLRLAPVQPKEIRLPAKNEANLPKSIEPIPLINKSDSYWTQVKALLFKRPQFILRSDYFTYIDSLKVYSWIPENFVYDFASIPKFVPVVKPTGMLAYPSLPHDFGYRFGGLFIITEPEDTQFCFFPLRRKVLDYIFNDLAAKANGLTRFDSLATGMVRIFGGSNYAPRDPFAENWDDLVYPN